MREQKRATRQLVTCWPVFAWREFPASSSFSRRAQSDFPASELIDGSAGSGLMRKEWRTRKKGVKSAKGKRPRWNHVLIKVDQVTKKREKLDRCQKKKKKVLTLCINSPADNRSTDDCANTSVLPEANKILGFGESKLMDHTTNGFFTKAEIDTNLI